MRRIMKRLLGIYFTTRFSGIRTKKIGSSRLFSEGEHHTTLLEFQVAPQGCARTGYKKNTLSFRLRVCEVSS